MTHLPPIGARIELVACDDPYTRLVPGSRGTVTGSGSIPAAVTGHAYSSGQIHVRWDDGSTLMLLEGEDTWRVIDEDDDAAIAAAMRADLRASGILDGPRRVIE